MAVKKSGPGRYYELDYKKHGIGGLSLTKPKWRKQDRRAKSVEFFAVVFFPKIRGIGKAKLGFWRLTETLSQSREAAITKFIDGRAQGETWASYHKAGHRVRKVKITDLGDA